ncbi:MAG: CpaF family protein [Kiritimatiellae bacterium]|nr:CpaF family protein [Kiritimatiellia bacterium]
MGSSNGTLVNSSPITGSVQLSPSAIVSVGNTIFRVSPKQPCEASTVTPSPRPEPPTPVPATPQKVTPPAPQPAPTPPTPEVNPRDLAIQRDIKSQIHNELVRRLDLKRLSSGVTPEELARRVRETLQAILKEVTDRNALPRNIDPEALLTEIYDESIRLGPVERFLADETVTEVMINGPSQVYVERNGRLTLTDQTFMDDASVLAVIERIVAPLGRRIDESQPYVDARLADGSRVNAIIPPLSLIGPCITIRKFAKRILTTEDFVRFGTWTPAIAAFLNACVKLRKNIIVAGGTGSGKTTLLNVLSGFIPSTDRILTIEDAAELRLAQPHVVRLEARPPNIEGKGAVTIRDLVRNALRMRPDRIIVGECRGSETLDMLQAMNTGHDGSLTTVHANTPRDVISRLETMVLMSGVDLPSRAIREQIASAVQIIVQEARLSDGSRKIIAISEITGMEGPQIVMQDLFLFQQTGVDSNGKIVGTLKPTGAMPTFFENFAQHGIALDPLLFTPEG